MPNPTQRDQVFISYSHRDQRIFEQLQTILKPLVSGKKISIWDDTKIESGDEWREEIRKAIASAKVAVLLVSPDFLASNFIVEHELPPLLDAAQNEGLRILWVAVRDSLYEETVIERYQCVNDPARPLASISGAGREKELVRICKEIKAAAPALTTERQNAPFDDRSSSDETEPGEPARADVLRVTVASPEEFLEAIGSNRVIELSGGTYDLSSVKDRYMKYVRWEPVHDGRSVTIRDVDNLIIRGVGPSKTRLLVVPRYAHVLTFENCRGIDLSDLTLGHAPAGYCLGGVLSVLGSEDVRVARCALFGSGIEGLNLRTVRTFRMTDCEVFDCTYGIATIESCKDIVFTKTVFRNNKEFWGFAIRDSEYIEFEDVDVISNECSEELFDIVSAWPVRFVGGTIAHNRCKGLGSIDTQGSTIQADFYPTNR